MTYILSKESTDEKSGETAPSKTCRDYDDNPDFDQCIEQSVSIEMGRLFNCSLPFFRPDESFCECRLDTISDSHREHITDAFSGQCCLFIILSVQY